MNPEKYLPSQEEINLKGKTIREKITNAAKMLGAAAMMAGIGQTAEAATTPNLDTRSQESAVEKIAKEKGQDGTLYGFNAKVLESKFGDKISFIETKDGTRITTENYKGSLVFLDRKGDGNLDRVIFNNDNTESRGNKNTKSKLNSKYLTQSFAELSLMASIDSKDIKIYALKNNNGEYVIRSINLNNGESRELTGKEAKKLTDSFQNGYKNLLGQFQK